MRIEAHTFGRAVRTLTASGSNLASVSVERVSPAYPLQARFPVPVAATPVVPYWDFHPSGSFLLLQLHVHILPLRSTVVTRFPATMGLSDSRPEPLSGLWIPPTRWRSVPPLSRASQVPRRICPRAPSTSTPESPTTVCAHSSSPVSGFIRKGRTGHSQLYPFTRPNRFAFATAHEFAFPGFARRIAPAGAGSATCTMGNLHG